MSTEPSPLRETLLEAEPEDVEARPGSPWAHAIGGLLVASLFVLYHASILVIWNLPHKGLAKQFHTEFLAGSYAKPYFNGTRNTQSWAMFAPNPNRTNTFIQVLVTDQSGDVWDLELDAWQVDRYPYLWYDRGGKVNRRLDAKKSLQRMFGAWACRDWERGHEGESAHSVRFVRHWTRVPEARVVIERGGWNQWEAPVKQLDQETILCKTVINGQLSNELRQRYGLDPLEDESKVFRRIQLRSWWDEQEIVRKREEKQVERDAARKRWQAREQAHQAKTETETETQAESTAP